MNRASQVEKHDREKPGKWKMKTIEHTYEQRPPYCKSFGLIIQVRKAKDDCCIRLKDLTSLYKIDPQH